MDQRNYTDDQQNEIEALDSIYCGEMEILAVEPFHKFRIPICTEDYNKEEEEGGLFCFLVFTYTEKYPDSAPEVEVEDPVNFEDGYVKEIIEHIKETIVEHLGMEMIFSLVSSAQEYLNIKWDQHRTQQEEQRMIKLKAEEEIDRQRFDGTRVTVESFLIWRQQFELDLGIAAKREKALGENKKLTGRELFLRDTTLNESDLKFLLEAGESIENVKIDESLFQNLDDLDLDSDTEDEDYNPNNDDSS